MLFNEAPRADPGSLLGMLQRGRGRGWLDATQAPPHTVWPLILDCLIHDPRFDPQCEDRDSFFGELIIATGMDLEPIRTHLAQHHADRDEFGHCVRLIRQTLRWLARGPSADARRILHEYLAYGEDWYWVLDDLADLETPAELSPAVETLVARMGRDAACRARFQETVRERWDWLARADAERRAKGDYFLPFCEPWRTLCAQQPALAALFDGVGIAYDQPPPPPTPISLKAVARRTLAQLFADVTKQTFFPFRRVLLRRVGPADVAFLAEQFADRDEYRQRLAVRGLAAVGTPEAFVPVRQYFEAGEPANRSVRSAAVRALPDFPPDVTLDTARRWFARDERYLQVAGGEILEHHATPDDAPLLLGALRTPATLRDEDNRQRSTLRGLARLDNLGWIPELAQVYCETPNAFARFHAAEAMAVTAPQEFAARYAVECLWDCHWDTLSLGCRTADRSAPGVEQRLRTLAADTWESESVREAARAALARPA